MSGFKPFSLADAIKDSQAIRMNEMKLQSIQGDLDRNRSLREMAQASTRPVYSEAEGPAEEGLARPEIQTGTEYDPAAHVKKLQAAGETELASNVTDHMNKLDEGKREEFTQKTQEAAKRAIVADTPEKWDEMMYEAVQSREIKKALPFEAREKIIAMGRSVEDILKQKLPKAPKTRNIREGKYIVNQEWQESTQTWKEVGRGPMSQQSINLRNKPSEVAAGKEFQSILDQSNIAEDQLAVVHRAKALLPTIETGKLEPVKQWAREWGSAFGVPIDTTKMVDSASFRSVMKGAVLDGMRSIKGTASEADRKTVEDSIAAIDNPEEANKFLLDVSESLARRKIEQANFWDNYAAANNSSLLGAKAAWSKRIHNTPLIQKVKGKIHHYYKFRDQLIQANRAAFKDASNNEIDRRVDELWARGE